MSERLKLSRAELVRLYAVLKRLAPTHAEIQPVVDRMARQLQGTAETVRDRPVAFAGGNGPWFK